MIGSEAPMLPQRFLLLVPLLCLSLAAPAAATPGLARPAEFVWQTGGGNL